MIKLLLLALSGAKLGKLFASGGTMLISLVVYAFVFGWRYAAGFVALLFAHEMGHDVAARQRGLAVGLPTENQRYYTIAPRRRLEYLALYFGLAAYLAFMAYRTHSLIAAGGS